MEIGFSRRNIGRLVLLGWAVALAWLARRQFSQADAGDTAARTRRLAPGAQYFAVYAGARQVGQLNLSVDTLVDGVRLTELMVMDLPLGDSTGQLARGSEYSLTRSLRLRHFTRTVYGIGEREKLEGNLGADSILALTNTEGPGGAGVRMRLRIPPDAMLPVMLTYRAAFSGQLRAGGRFAAPLLDLGAEGTRQIAVQVTAESTFVVPDSAVWDSVKAEWVPVTADTLRGFRLEHDAGGAPTVSWVDENGALLRQETAGGLTLVRSAFEIVRNNYRSGRVSEHSGWRRLIPGMIALTASGVAPDTLAPEHAFLRGTDSGGTVTGGSRELGGGRQQLQDDTLIVRRYTPPDTIQHDIREARSELGPSWETPVLDEGMTAAASRALAGARTPTDSAEHLTLWVARQIATDAGEVSSATAGPTLRARRGNADGKARLLATLARVSGIPARVVTGVAVLPKGTFGHAWTELWIGGWVAADPTYGHYPASASLVRLAVGQRSNPLDLLPLAASARFLPIRRPL
ncbi:MAG TPA: transglutaminase-like domain-containing protein [Gemmatimonadales bacterium]|nr:transglutaminase-like domain-containing protein [Gemmatimonadales bacterium]